MATGALLAGLTDDSHHSYMLRLPPIEQRDTTARFMATIHTVPPRTPRPRRPRLTHCAAALLVAAITLAILLPKGRGEWGVYAFALLVLATSLAVTVAVAPKSER